ncbi:hypothetical protein evm_010008 [Chilo suppressalis]|nr:hypothetical protein evm_010008 [Chilo suppressalis]
MQPGVSCVRTRWWMWAAWACAWSAPSSGSLLPLEVERLRASVGGYAVMNCHLDFPFGNEIPYHLQWDKDDETILSWYSGEAGGAAGSERVADRWGGRLMRLADGRLGLGRGSVNVTAVRETDAGLYRCRVSFPNRTPPARNNGTFYYLDVDGGNLIVTPPMNVTVLEGDRAELECLPKHAEATVQWFRDELPLESLPELAARAELPRNGSLVLRAAHSADPGEFQCRVQDPDGTTQSASAFLDVQYKAKVVYSPAERYLPYGKPASLDCHFSANPPLTNLRWEKDGFLFDPYNVPGVFYSRNGSLLFNQVDESHEGEYSCTPYNALGSAGASAGVRVRVARPPALAARPHPLYVARLGDRLTLPCAIAADPQLPQPDLRWTRKDGSELAADRHSIQDGNLTIDGVSEEDRGVYVCTVTNDAASVAAEAELMVENLPPRAPHNLTARLHTHSVQLAWVPGHNGVEVEYQVWYRERGAGQWRTLGARGAAPSPSPSPAPGPVSVTVPGLRPATAYELRVLAQDHIGDGLFSKPIFITTLVPIHHWSIAYVAPSRPLATTAHCFVRWYRGPPPGDHLLLTAHTTQDYMLVEDIEEGGEYWARVECGGGATAGGAALHVPAYGRLRAVAGGCAGAALLLAAALTAAYLARRHLRPHPRPHAPRDKRAR